MKVNIDRLDLPETVRVMPEAGIENLIADIRERGQLRPIRVRVNPYQCWQGHDGNLPSGDCPVCGLEGAVTPRFTVVDGWRRVKALQFLGVSCAEVEII